MNDIHNHRRSVKHKQVCDTARSALVAKSHQFKRYIQDNTCLKTNHTGQINIRTQTRKQHQLEHRQKHNVSIEYRPVHSTQLQSTNHIQQQKSISISLRDTIDTNIWDLKYVFVCRNWVMKNSNSYF